MTIPEYIAQVEKLAERSFGKVEVGVKTQGIHHCSMRIVFSDRMFLDVYYHMLTQRKDFALIHHNKRIFGIDNYEGWHIHPADEPERHIPCGELTEEEVFESIRDAMRQLNINEPS